MSDPTAKLKTSKEQEMKMEKNSLEVLQEAMDILKAKNPELAYAGMAGYLMAFADLKTAQMVLQMVKESN
jgi:hypothetical protein